MHDASNDDRGRSHSELVTVTVEGDGDGAHTRSSRKGGRKTRRAEKGAGLVISKKQSAGP